MVGPGFRTELMADLRKKLHVVRDVDGHQHMKLLGLRE
ncbi:hypothetical protein TVNIR_1551 [Thioalkalivibrio nitratireducens DSM 14787]|uniref:Uncharacterized protein n=1 Tax=Thioalkalivibrio nitratireducens (strain DSM 14787 / UNIQEM 213 / ALEN2) TaxID=1255043 RepID=L0DW11_THIND|nr:hypothetical protein TVNIR_1551 [Thioalkalivibrio nitratireducens DSM 14787]